MLITNGDIFKSEMDCIVIPTNVVGVLGKGVALEAKKLFLGLDPIYKDLCLTKQHTTETPSYIPRKENWTHDLVLFATKQHWKNPSKIEYIKSGLLHLESIIYLYKIESIALCALGCGLGGLSIRDVKPLIEELANKINGCTIALHLPQ